MIADEKATFARRDREFFMRGRGPMKKIIFLVSLLYSSGKLFCHKEVALPVDRSHLILLHTELGKYYCVSYLYDPLTDKTYIIKQKNELFTPERRALQAIRELLGTHVANSIDIPSQRVWFVPAEMPFVGKFFENLVATLHMVVPGVAVKECPSWQHLNIRQRQIGKTGEGLSRQVITSMSQHPDLSGIVALDTMGGNCGRHNKNYFYDGKSKRFYVIDMGGFYKRSHVVATCQNIEQMLNNQAINFTQKEVAAIVSYRNMLMRIQQLFSKEASLDKLNEFVDQASLSPEVAQYVVHSISKCLVDNYAAIDKLLHLLHLLIDAKRQPQREFQTEECHNIYETMRA